MILGKDDESLAQGSKQQAKSNGFEREMETRPPGLDDQMQRRNLGIRGLTLVARVTGMW